MGCVDISVNAQVWEVLYVSVFLEGEEREAALRRLRIFTEPPCA